MEFVCCNSCMYIYIICMFMSSPHIETVNKQYWTATRCLLFHKHICHPHPVRDLNMVHGLKFKPILKENMLLKLDSFPQFGDENIKYLKPAPKNLLELKSFVISRFRWKSPTDHPSYSSRSLTDSLICNLWLIIFGSVRKGKHSQSPKITPTTLL